ncbi:MAG: hypothetical protein IPI67_29710 [Myxococcales bacterium]|nr:hypothetical protein [Myxococcales bacterium]
MLRHTLIVSLAVAAACGGQKAQDSSAKSPGIEEKSSEPGKTEPKLDEEAAAKAKADNAPITELPTECAKKDDKLCVPSSAFTNRLCQGNFPSVALAMFKKGSPWTRGYLTRKTKAWNASGGAASSDELEFDEEVLVLRHRSDDLGGMQVSGAGGGYDALRWNGSCVTLAKEELTLSSPPKAKSARVEWRLIDDGMRDVMRNDAKLDKSFKDRQKECKGATMGDVTAKCVKLDNALSEAVVGYVRNGGDVGKPARLP